MNIHIVSIWEAKLKSGERGDFTFSFYTLYSLNYFFYHMHILLLLKE